MAVVIGPYLSFLAAHRYPLGRVECVVTLAAFAVWIAILAFVLRQRQLFALGLTTAFAAAGAVHLQRVLPSTAPPLPWFYFAVLLAILYGLWMAMGDRLFQLAAVFSLSVIGASLLNGFHAPLNAANAHLPGHPVRGHFVYIVLDEHLGVSGFPDDIPLCREARAEVQSLYLRYGFDVFPNAFSNYPVTLDSVPAILNRRLVRKDLEQVSGERIDRFGVYHFDTARFFDTFRRRGLSIDVTESQSMDFLGARPGTLIAYPDSLSRMSEAPINWKDKATILMGRYQHSDPVFREFKGLLPFLVGDRATYPLASAALWPRELLAHIVAAPRPTLFFVHLLLPHFPYLYRADGSIRPRSEWAEDQADGRLPDSAYLSRYNRYAEQVLFATSQMRSLLAALQSDHLLDSMTIVVHGDHGSRIRRIDTRGLAPDPSRRYPIQAFDYASTPAPQDLRDRFSALLAVKPPNQQRGSLVPDHSSVLRVLAQTIFHESPPRGSDNLYLFDSTGAAVEISSERLWETD